MPYEELGTATGDAYYSPLHRGGDVNVPNNNFKAPPPPSIPESSEAPQIAQDEIVPFQSAEAVAITSQAKLLNLGGSFSVLASTNGAKQDQSGHLPYTQDPSVWAECKTLLQNGTVKKTLKKHVGLDSLSASHQMAYTFAFTGRFEEACKTYDHVWQLHQQPVGVGVVFCGPQNISDPYKVLFQ